MITVKVKQDKKLDWFINDRLGMFIHWGIFAVHARGEWARSYERISNEEYQPFFDKFKPKKFNPIEWARIAKQAGMKYVVLTAKHHDGFCLFDSKYTEYKSTNTPFKRDIVKEVLDAFRKEGIKVGVYYSLLDWYHPDYPKYNDMYSPMRGNHQYKNDDCDFDNYLTYLHNQVEELCKNYGKLDLLWFDFSYDDMRGEKWQATKLVNMVRSYHPDIIVNNRLEVSGEGFGSIVTDDPTVYSGDFITPEQIIPPNGMINDRGEPLPWEACITLNNHWGYFKNDNEHKTGDMLIRKLVECVSKGGNFLLNVGPDANGVIPKKSLEALKQLGEWLEKNGESIYNCTRSGIDKPEYGRITRKGNKYYFHVTEPVIGPIPLYGIQREEVDNIRILSTGEKLPIASSWVVGNYKEYVFVYYGEEEGFTCALPDAVDTVIEVTLKG